MTSRLGTTLVALALAVPHLAVPLAARTTGPLFDEYEDDGGALEPPGPPPATTPPSPPMAPPPQATPPRAAPAPVQPAPAPRPAGTGQWVFTAQYGWVWMPYGESYTYLPPDGSTPTMYVYYPEAGWCWVVAPWLWGLGPRPYFVAGPSYYVWFGVGLGHWYGYASPYRHWGWPGRAYWHGGGWHGVDRGYGGHGGGWRGVDRGYGGRGGGWHGVDRGYGGHGGGGRWNPGQGHGGGAPRR